MLKDRVALVTGASRGVGKGIAVALGAAGATVYVTGRSGKAGDNPFGGTVFATAEDVTRRGGTRNRGALRSWRRRAGARAVQANRG